MWTPVFVHYLIKTLRKARVPLVGRADNSETKGISTVGFETIPVSAMMKPKLIRACHVLASYPDVKEARGS